MGKFIKFEHENHNIYVSLINGNQLIIPQNDEISIDDLNQVLVQNGMFVCLPEQKTYSRNLFRTVYICLHSSNQCNMKCKYCFMQDRHEVNITIDEAKKFIDFIISRYPNAEKFIVDPTGSGEPLLRMEFILKLADYCHYKSNIIYKEVLPMLVTNGTLLTQDIVKKLQSSGYIFGVSIDGYKKIHDANRVGYERAKTFKKILKNVKKIKHKEYLGAAVTLTDGKMNLVKTLKTMSKQFSTISIKPVRAFSNKVVGINENNIEEIKRQYTRLYDFLCNMTFKRNLSYLSAILNGDDYFGKFIFRVMLNSKVSTRCDAGLGRFSLTPDKKIIACPGSIGIDDLVLGSLDKGLYDKKIISLWEIQSERKHCGNCEAKFVCGGECFVLSHYKSGGLSNIDEVMCQLKKHLFQLAVKFKYDMLLKDKKLFKIIFDGCQQKANRFKEDKELIEILTKLDGKFTFMELKKIKDDNYKKYILIKEGLN